uniref:Aspartyl/asparaginy/proline hydroxylase domain-containing protein n=1 Tax=Alexandrium monilatum TaxID=311494 RepID=A0A7S4VT15_9DINO
MSEADSLWTEGVRAYFLDAGGGEPEGALRYFQASLAEASASPRAPLALRLLFCARLLLEAGCRELAVGFLRRAVCEDPELHEAHVELCLVLSEAGDAPGARAAAASAIVEGGLWRDPWQRPSAFLPGLDSQPFWDADRFPWVLELETAFGAIRAELDCLMHSTHWQPVGGDHRSSGRSDGDAVLRGDWQEIVLFGYEEEAGDAGRRAAPVAADIVRRLIPEAVSMAEQGAGEVVLSTLAPGTQVAAHCARTNHRLTCHLGLRVPRTPGSGRTGDASARPRCGLRVGGQQREWCEGKALVFDDSYEHEVWNDTKDPRVVLLVRFWHPSLASAPVRARALELLQGDLATAQRRRLLPPLGPGLQEPGEALEGLLRGSAGAVGDPCPYCNKEYEGGALGISEDGSRVVLTAQCCGRTVE